MIRFTRREALDEEGARSGSGRRGTPGSTPRALRRSPSNGRPAPSRSCSPPNRSALTPAAGPSHRQPTGSLQRSHRRGRAHSTTPASRHHSRATAITGTLAAPQTGLSGPPRQVRTLRTRRGCSGRPPPEPAGKSVQAQSQANVRLSARAQDPVQRTHLGTCTTSTTRTLLRRRVQTQPRRTSDSHGRARGAPKRSTCGGAGLRSPCSPCPPLARRPASP